MKKKMVDPDMPIGKLTLVKDFLPPPSELAISDNEKITIILNKEDIEFFKAQAKKHHTKYQKMIRAVIGEYVAHFRKAA